MSLFLASVETIAEAELAAAADIIDCKKGLFSPWSPKELEEMGRRGGSQRKSAVLGAFADATAAADALKAAVSLTEFDFIKLGLVNAEPSKILSLSDVLPPKPAAVLTLFAEEYRRDERLFAAAATVGFKGIMLDTRNKNGGNLFTELAMETCGEFVSSAAKHRLFSGLAGGLNIAAIGRYLGQNLKHNINNYPPPTVVGFRGALCGDRRRHLQRHKVERIAYLIASQAKAAAGAHLETSTA